MSAVVHACIGDLHGSRLPGCGDPRDADMAAAVSQEQSEVDEPAAKGRTA
jgi:hypothetical protein